MAIIPTYSSLADKRPKFCNGNDWSFVINTEVELSHLLKEIDDEHNVNGPVGVIYRGCNNARYQQYNSAQRYWIENDLRTQGIGYYDFLSKLLMTSKSMPVINHVFNRYGYNKNIRDFPIFALLQHYGAPTPCLDWTYTINSALYFAVSNSECDGSDSIDNYMSIYRINKTKHRNEFMNYVDWSRGRELEFNSFQEWNNASKNTNICFYLSDFEPDRFSLDTPDYRVYPSSGLQICNSITQTSLFNQNIILQDGLLVFNPHEDRCMERLFGTSGFEEGANIMLTPFYCYNIHKRLINFIKKNLLDHLSMNDEFMVPQMSKVIQDVKRDAGVQ